MPDPTPTHASPWRDSPARYGRISRWLHWGMALLLGWQFAGMLAKVGLGRAHALTQWLAPAHSHIGLLLLLLVLLRAGWGLANLGRRPRDRGVPGLLAWAGHGLLYLLMLAVPALAALRMYGNSHRFVWFGLVELNDGQGGRIDWMVELARAWHGTLGWVLLALIAGHVLMVLVHRWLLADGIDRRMLGRVRD